MQKPIYIQAASAVSPQRSFKEMMNVAERYTDDKMQCIEPDYTKYVDAKLIRRMSRIIKMGVAAASECLQQAGVQMPDAIITGTAYGCLADTDQFLTRLVEFKEELLSPTAFIQSTHNTVAAQIALMLQCHNYNNTYVHRGSSFEAALLDAISLIKDDAAETVLVGGADEIIDKSHNILQRFGLYKKDGDSATLLQSKTKGTMAGEGAAFFLLNNKYTEGAIAKIDAVNTYYKPGLNSIYLIQNFLEENNITINDVDTIIMGNNGDARQDGHYSEIVQTLFAEKNVIGYKNFCGEYPTSSAFGLWYAANMVSNKSTTDTLKTTPLKILLYNNYMLQYPSLYLVSAC